MSAGMAEVIAAHIPIGFWEAPDDEMDSAFCECGYEAEAMGKAKNFHAAHVAEELTQAGYGLMDPLAAALADPEGHALVKAIHDRKVEA